MANVVAPAPVQSFWSTKHGKALRSLVWVFVSGGLVKLSNVAGSDPTAFGVYTGLVNAVLVYVKQFIDEARG